MEIPLEYLIVAFILFSTLVWFFSKRKEALVLAAVAVYILAIYILGSRYELGSLWYFTTMIGGALLLRYLVHKSRNKLQKSR
jgi:hypothetical protein